MGRSVVRIRQLSEAVVANAIVVARVLAAARRIPSRAPRRQLRALHPASGNEHEEVAEEFGREGKEEVLENRKALLVLRIVFFSFVIKACSSPEADEEV